jgi:hypothetical protein
MANSQRRIKKSQHQSKPSRTEEPYDGKGTTQSVELGSWLRAPLKETAVERDRAQTALATQVDAALTSAKLTRPERKPR